jgi:hypothetical protein
MTTQDLTKRELRLLRKSLVEYIDYLEGFDDKYSANRVIEASELKTKLRNIKYTKI